MKTTTKLIIAECMLPFAMLWWQAYSTRGSARNDDRADEKSVVVDQYKSSICDDDVPMSEHEFVDAGGSSFADGINMLGIKVNYDYTTYKVEPCKVSVIFSDSVTRPRLLTHGLDSVRVELVDDFADVYAYRLSAGPASMTLLMPESLVPDHIVAEGGDSELTVEGCAGNNVWLTVDMPTVLRDCRIEYLLVDKNSIGFYARVDLTLDRCRIGELTMPDRSKLSGGEADIVEMTAGVSWPHAEVEGGSSRRTYISRMGEEYHSTSTTRYRGVSSVTKTETHFDESDNDNTDDE